MGELKEKLRKALAECRLDYDEVIEKAKNGEAQFLEVEGAVAVTALVTSGGYSTCWVIAVAGNLSNMSALDAKVTEWARVNGCQAIETMARPGWSRIAPPAPGYEPVAIKYRKVLEVGK